MKLILDGQGNHFDAYTISLESFRSFRGPLFRKPVTGQELFLLFHTANRLSLVGLCYWFNLMYLIHQPLVPKRIVLIYKTICLFKLPYFLMRQFATQHYLCVGGVKSVYFSKNFSSFSWFQCIKFSFSEKVLKILRYRPQGFDVTQ